MALDHRRLIGPGKKIRSNFLRWTRLIYGRPVLTFVVRAVASVLMNINRVTLQHIQRQQFLFRKTSIKVSLKILSLQASSLSLRFQPASLCLLFSKMNSRQENGSKLSFTARIITKYSLERFLSICGEKMSKGFLKFCKLISNLILGQIIVSNLTNVHKPNSRINYARLH